MRLVSDCGLFSAWVEVDGVEKPVYDGKRVDGRDRRMEGYFASETGKSYVVHLDASKWGASAQRYTSAYRDLEATLYIDGNKIDGIATDFEKGLHRGCMSWTGAPVGLRVEKAFVFARPELVESARPMTEEAAKSLGTLRISIRRLRRRGQPYVNDRLPSAPCARSQVAEGSKKLLSDVTQFGVVKPIKRDHRIDVDFNPSDTALDPYGCLVLKYSEEGVLKARCIIPKTPAEIAEEAKAAAKKDNTPIDIDEDKPNLEEEDSEGEEEDEAENARRQEETETLMARLAELQAKQAATRAKKRKRPVNESQDQVQEDDKSTILRDEERAMASRLKKAKARDGGVVDLTGED